jgi:2-oxoglutarate dehydrogenase E1 component
MRSESFEKSTTSDYPNEKCFGLEGCESLVPDTNALIDCSVKHRVKHVTIGVPYRGRLNVLANAVRKPIKAVLNEFKGHGDPDDWPAGDVKHHLGANYVRPTLRKKVSLSLVASLSHLMAEDPVGLGKTRTLQHLENDKAKHKTAFGVLLHGDAAFAGRASSTRRWASATSRITVPEEPSTSSSTTGLVSPPTRVSLVQSLPVRYRQDHRCADLPR